MLSGKGKFKFVRSWCSRRAQNTARFSSGTNLQCTLAGASGIPELNFKISGRREGAIDQGLKNFPHTPLSLKVPYLIFEVRL
ncbi:MAG: hypothetical protein Ct9H300mP21_01790 [Pseudomonadota bacterium]|nr:MAG: hypothetical protein Ct9H300mP21_01790 [Pseudomonadota bacterium]